MRKSKIAFTDVIAGPAPAMRMEAQTRGAGSVGQIYSGNQGRLRRLSSAPAGMQAKLEIGDAHDPLEREADSMAEHVTGSSDGLQTKLAPSSSTAGPVPKQFGESVPGGGQPLSTELRTSMEPKFGYDFSRVRVHTANSERDDPARIGAVAYTIGENIVFSRDQYQPSSAAGRQLLAHELTHVVQQGKASPQGEGKATSLSSTGPRPQFGLFSAIKCSYYTYKMSSIRDACRAEYTKHCGGDITSDECLKYMDSMGAGYPSDAIFNCMRKTDPATFKSWLESCGKTASGSYGNSKYTSNDSQPPGDAAGGGAPQGGAGDSGPGAEPATANA